MEELDIFEKMNAIGEAPQFSMIFGEGTEQVRKIAEHRSVQNASGGYKKGGTEDREK